MVLELGVFMPVGNNGWIISESSPQYMPTYDLNRQITLLAEEVGFDYIFSMCKWRGSVAPPASGTIPLSR